MSLLAPKEATGEDCGRTKGAGAYAAGAAAGGLKICCASCRDWKMAWLATCPASLTDTGWLLISSKSVCSQRFISGADYCNVAESDLLTQGRGAFEHELAGQGKGSHSYQVT